MPDIGTKAADRGQEEIARKLKRIYRQARKEINEKLIAYTEEFAKEDARMQKLLNEDKITPAKYRRWKKAEVFRGKNWKALSRQASEILSRVNEAALSIISDEKLGVFATNANYMAYMLEQGAKMELAFAVYDEETVKQLIADEPDLMPRKWLNKRKDRAWITHQIDTAITQGIIQGESIEDTANRIAKQTGDSNEIAMLRYARTAMTSAQNAGRIETMHRAQGMGITMKKQWLATLDKRTRDSHRHLDGQIREVDEAFDSDFGKIMFPGDPDAHPGDVYNCRCTLTYVFPEYPEENTKRRDNETGEEIDDLTYDEWLAMKGRAKS